MAKLALIACSHCGQLHERPVISPGAVASCTRCGFVLYRQSVWDMQHWIAFNLTTLAVFVIANLFPIATLKLQGSTVQATLVHALWVTWQQGYIFIALVTALFVLVFPLGQILFLFWAMRAVARSRLPADFRQGMRMLEVLARWSMVPVLLLAILVSMVKLVDLATVQFGPGLWAFVLSSFLLTGLGKMTALRLWRFAEDKGLVKCSGQDMGLNDPHLSCHACGFVQPRNEQTKQHCQRCGGSIHWRKPASYSRTWALVIAATVLYIPANVLPVMYIQLPTGTSPHTIMGGVIEFWRMGSWDLALIVFIASVVVPMAKLLALALLMLQRGWRSRGFQRQRTRLYEMVEFVGQWSMLDVFVVVLLSAMADFPGLSRITAGAGAVAFASVVILTIFAAMSYDPRLGWDADPEMT